MLSEDEEFEEALSKKQIRAQITKKVVEMRGDRYSQYLAFDNSLPVMEVHMPTKGDAITCWGNGFGFIPIQFWLKTKL
uniref:Uncharacterized protein n=1 Tax=Romanomermis culicivorax TaxID=13658 RepID=A0A915IWU3_ROMCU